MKVLLVEDQLELLENLSKSLKDVNIICETASSYEAANEKIHLYNYDVVILDINLPDGSGLNIIEQLKGLDQESGIIVISARNSLSNKIEGLNLGADDYLTKPFDPAELVARVWAIYRRKNLKGKSIINEGKLEIDLHNRLIKSGTKNIELTRSEYDILLYFVSNKNRVLTKESIAEHIWGDNMDMADSFDFIYSHIKNLRKKLKDNGIENPIKVVYGIGYRYENQ